jgi:integrase
MFRYLLDYVNEQGRRRRVSLGHCDKRRAESERAQKERELRMGILSPEPMKLSIFVEDSLARTGLQIRPSTQVEYGSAARRFIEVVGDVDYQQVSLRHAELFREACLGQGNSPATVSKKLRSLKRLFQLAVDRGQLDVNPFKKIAMPKSPKKKVRKYSGEECQQILQAARDSQTSTSVKWELLIFAALTTGMRKGELLNTTWGDIDFAAKSIEVCPKKDTKQTWAWDVKDCDRRLLPLTDELVSMLAEHQSLQPENYPYAFIPPYRYDRIQKLRQKRRQDLIYNFTRQFKKILKRAEVKNGTFHDLRRTALSNLLTGGLAEYDVMRIAGHSSFDITHRFYLATADNLLDRARRVCSDLAHTWHAKQLTVKGPNIK